MPNKPSVKTLGKSSVPETHGEQRLERKPQDGFGIAKRPKAAYDKEKISVEEFTVQGLNHHLLTYANIVLNFLLKSKRKVSAAEIKEETGLDLNNPSNRDLKGFIQRNETVSYEDGLYTYRFTHVIKTEEDMLGVLRKLRRERKHGLNINTLKQECPDAEKIASALAAENRIFLLQMGKDQKQRIAFYNPPSKIKSARTSFCDMWHKQAIPEAVNLKEKLEQVGLKSMAVFSKTGAVPKKLLKRPSGGRKRRYKITNVHLPELNVEKEF
ncbi:MAG: transcription initiation factor TFIIE subunit beta [Amphiamblys sp. WSBS2006]|nr:MAG: transcription initiation factor TFIIE subunit beta [Amphiamblys sp. WSBS2006]